MELFPSKAQCYMILSREKMRMLSVAKSAHKTNYFVGVLFHKKVSLGDGTQLFLEVPPRNLN